MNCFNQSIYLNKCIFYVDIKQFAKVYFVDAVAVRIHQSFPSPFYSSSCFIPGVEIKLYNYCIVQTILYTCIGSVNSLLSGNPYGNINVNNIADDYMNIFSTIVTRDRVSTSY